MTAQVFNMQRFSLFDGPGVRTVVFLNGCPLRCIWCHDPEGGVSAGQIMYNAARCMAQITTANREDLLDAKVHPERHGNLTVRVGGYSAQFVQLNAAAQDEIISRYV